MPSAPHSDSSSSPRAFLQQPSVLIPPLSSSPGGSSGSGERGAGPMASPSRSFNPNDMDRRERQRAQDLDSAMALSRARSGSVSTVHPSFSGASPNILPHLNTSALHPPPLLSHGSNTSSSHSHSHTADHRHASSHGAHRSPHALHPRSRVQSSDLDDSNFPMLSATEEAEMSLARGQSGYISEDVILESDAEPTIHDDYAERVRGGSAGSSGHDSVFRRLSGHDEDREDIIRRQEELEREGGSMRGMDEDGRSIGASTAGLMGPGMGVSHAMMQGMTGGFVGRNYFDYSQLENWAQDEKVLLGVGGRTPGVEGGPTGGLGASPSFSKRESLGGAVDENLIDTSNLPVSPTITPPEEPATPEHTFVRRRQRKLSHSNPNPHARRQGKLALFEGGGGGGGSNTMTGGSGASILGGNSNVKGPSSPLLPTSSRDSNTYDTFSKPTFLSQPNPPHPNHQLGNGNLQDRPYRFSFYSNALPATIHARSLSELPAEGQSFEDLFTGRGGAADEESIHQGGNGNGNGGGGPSSGTATPLSCEGGGGAIPMASAKESLLSRAMGNRNMLPPSVNGGDGGGGGGGNGNGLPKADDVEASTWWLDVLCPTDDEMKMLSRVFGIHPLTTEDIQMEETREKIELFRNYYLVCFRSFDQDPYSQTHLEPLNMYIIVFREGTLSFHFRGTPHPQNVRRRIKQLKDYIAVTSDWISYALIDDITDAFGPLIQSIEYEVDSIDELVLILNEAEQSDMLRRIGTCRKKVMGLLRLMGNKADVVKGLAKRCNENWSVAPRSDIGLYLSDIQDHLITMTQNLNHYEKILSRSHSNYLAAISVLMNSANNQTNEVLSRMTALGTILIPMNLITGLWGMNVHVPGEGIEGLHWFFGIIGCLLAFAFIGGFVTYRLFKNS